MMDWSSLDGGGLRTVMITYKRVDFAATLEEGAYGARRCADVVADGVLIADALPHYRRSGEFLSLVAGGRALTPDSPIRGIAARTLEQLYADLGGYGEDERARERAAATVGAILARNRPSWFERTFPQLCEQPVWFRTQRPLPPVGRSAGNRSWTTGPASAGQALAQAAHP